MPKTRKSHPPSLKAKVALEAIKAHKTAAQIAQMFGVHPTQVGGWKKQALAGLPDIFGNGREQVRQQSDAEKDELYKQIGQLKVELDFFKKELASSTDDKRQWIDPAHRRLSIQQQCELLGVPRSTYYYQPRLESPENLRLLRQLDQLYLKRPFFGSRKMAVELEVNRKRIQRLMRILGIEAHYPKPNLSRPAPGHQVYPYLLRGVAIERPNHVWSTDITYLPMRGGFLYLVAVMVTGSAASCSVGNSPIRWKPVSAWRRWRPRFVSASPKSGTPIRARSSPPRTFWLPSSSAGSRSAWTAAVARSTTFSSNGCGARSSTS